MAFYYWKKEEILMFLICFVRSQKSQYHCMVKTLRKTIQDRTLILSLTFSVTSKQVTIHVVWTVTLTVKCHVYFYCDLQVLYQQGHQGTSSTCGPIRADTDGRNCSVSKNETLQTTRGIVFVHFCSLQLGGIYCRYGPSWISQFSN